MVHTIILLLRRTEISLTNTRRWSPFTSTLISRSWNLPSTNVLLRSVTGARISIFRMRLIFSMLVQRMHLPSLLKQKLMSCRLKGHFSRLHHQTQAFYQRSAAHVLSSLHLYLPTGISNVYYYDLIGNVSTSKLQTTPSVSRNAKSSQYSVLEMKPRYPLMGGWNYSFTLGWDSPLQDSANWDAKNGRYVVGVPIMTQVPTAVIDDAEVKIILPEGAT